MRPGFGIGLPYVSLAMFGGIAAAAPELSTEWGATLFLASVVLFGLPHGAVDHLIMARLAGVPVLSARSAALVAGYVVLVVAIISLWLLAPQLVLVGFILITWFHWGQGDAWYRGRPGDPRLIACRGALPMLAPLLFHPEEYLAVCDAFVAASGATLSLPEHPLGLQLLAGVALPAVLLAEMRAAGRIVWEPLALLAFFAVAPPVYAIAVYFCFWHAPRHLVRLTETLHQPTWRGLALVLRDSAPLTSVSVVIVVGVHAALTTNDMFSVYLAVIAALTVPHVVVVSWQDLHSKREI